jgi:hypothetical protein
MTDTTTGLDTPNAGHIDVEEHSFIINHAQTRESLFSIARFGYLEAKNAKRRAQTASQRGVVLYNQ